MFIHTHYSHLNEILSGAQDPPPSHQEKRLDVVYLLPSTSNAAGYSVVFIKMTHKCYTVLAKTIFI